MSNSPEIGSQTRIHTVMEKYGTRTKKSSSQNLLTDLNVLKNIVEAADITANDNVIETGPGIGALTGQLAQVTGEVLALEIDQDLIPVLEEVLSPYDNVRVTNQDVLQANLPELIRKEFENPSRPIEVVANLPYYITSLILMNLPASLVEQAAICVMIQKEVAQRLTVKSGIKQHDELTLAIEYQMQAKTAFDVSWRVFMSPPNADSATAVSTPRADPLSVQPFDKRKLFGFIQGCFAHRRKNLWNNLQSVIGKDPMAKEKMAAVLAQLDISP